MERPDQEMHIERPERLARRHRKPLQEHSGVGTRCNAPTGRWHKETEKRFLHLLSQIQVPWTVPFQNNRYHLSYVISSDDEKLHLREFHRVLEEVVNETRNTVWKGWSMFYPFNDPENKPRIYPEKTDGSGGEVLETHFMDFGPYSTTCRRTLDS